MAKKKARESTTRKRMAANEAVKLAKEYAKVWGVEKAVLSSVENLLTTNGVYFSDALEFTEAVNSFPFKTHPSQRTVVLLGYFLCCAEKILHEYVLVGDEFENPF